MFNRQNSTLRIFEQEFNILNSLERKFEGIQIPTVFGGTPGTFFTWHTEDYNLYSANFHIQGAEKVWYTVPQKHTGAFEKWNKGGLDSLLVNIVYINFGLS